MLTKMKKWMCLGFSFLLICFSVLGSTNILAQEKKNYIANPEFQDVDGNSQFDSWNYWSSGGSDRAQSSADQGILTISASGENLVLNQILSNVTAENSYHFHATLKTEKFTHGAAIIRYQFLNKSNQSLSTTEIVKVMNNQDWKDIDQDIMIPKSVDNSKFTDTFVAKVKLEIMVSSPTTGVMHVKNLRLEDSIQPAQDNLLINPTYQDTNQDGKIDHWNYWPVTGDYKVAAKQGILTMQTNNTNITLHQSIMLSSEQLNKKYHFEGDIACDELKSGTASYRIQIVDHSNRSLMVLDTNMKIKDTTDWQHVQLDFDVPDTLNGSAVAGIKLEHIVSKSTGTAYFKNIKLSCIGEMDKHEEGDPMNSLIFNGGYEKVNGTMPESWSLWKSSGGLNVESDEHVFKDGYRSVHIHDVSSTTPSRGTIYQSISPVSDEIQMHALKISQWIKTKDFTGKGLSIRLQYVAENGSIPTMYTQILPVSNTQDWTQYTYTIDLPPLPLKSIKLEYLYDESNGDVWIDDTLVNGYVKAENIEITPASSIMNVNDTLQLSADITPKQATISTLSFESSDTSIVTVDDQGLLHALKNGTAVIRVKHVDGIEKEIAVVVNPQGKENAPIHFTTKMNTMITKKILANAELLASPSHGTVILDHDQMSYYPEKDYTGSDAFTFVLKSEDGSVALQPVNVDVTAVNEAPQMEKLILQMNMNEPVSGKFQAMDKEHDSLSYTLLQPGSHGTFDIHDDTYTYTPEKDYHGYDYAMIQVKDTYGNITNSEVIIYIANTPQALIQSVKDEHPRLLATATDFDHIRTNIQKDTNAKAWYQDVLHTVDPLLEKPVVPYQLSDGVRLDTQGSKDVVNLAFVWQITHDETYAKRAWKELDSLCRQYPDWHPDHLLDTAMTANGVAIAYDWLYDYLNEEQRNEVSKVLYEKGLQVALSEYNANHRFVTDGYNWNFVCNSGFATSALALAHHENPDYCNLSGIILQKAYRSIQYGLPQYAPQGDSQEGISYWDYGTRYLVSFLSCISSATGENEFLATPGLKETALFPIYMSGKAGTYNYSDNDMMDAAGYLNLWFAKIYNEPSYTWYHKYYMNQNPHSANIYDLLYYDPSLYQGETPVQLDKQYDAQSIITMRHDFTDPDSSFLGFKGGFNGAPHGDLDIGSFVYDVDGERWAFDFGKENYNLPGYWDMNQEGLRWQYYRKNALGHNTLVIHPENGANQSLQVKSNVIESQLNEQNGGYGILDMSDAYQKYAVDVKRGFAYFHRNEVLIRDEFTLKHKDDIYWQMHTDADVTIAEDGQSVILSKNGKQVKLRLIDEQHLGQRFEVMDAKAYPGITTAPNQSDNTGVHKLFIHSIAQKGTFNVWIMPLNQDNQDMPEILPLSKWHQYDFKGTKKPDVTPDDEGNTPVVKPDHPDTTPDANTPSDTINTNHSQQNIHNKVDTSDHTHIDRIVLLLGASVVLLGYILYRKKAMKK